MSAAEDISPESEADRIEGWRLRCLVRAGWPYELAVKIAADFTVDLTEACDLVQKRNCPPDIAYAIFS